LHRTKGITFQHIRTFCEKRFGQNGFTVLLDSLEPDERFLVEQVVAIGWYDLTLYAKLLRALDAHHGRGESLVEPLARYEAEQDYKTVHRLFFRLASPAFLIEKTAQYWSRFQDSGTWRIDRRGDRSVQGVLEGWADDEVLCRELSGYMARAIELVGGKGVVIAHPSCRGRGDPMCQFMLTWR
jgi:hypothetical protein